MVTHLTLLEIWHEIEIAAVIGVGSWVMLFPVKTFVKKVVGAWNEQENLLKDMKEELVTQRTNCLKTLQEQGKTQIETLVKVAGTLDSMHTQQSEMNGFIKGLAESRRA